MNGAIIRKVQNDYERFVNNYKTLIKIIEKDPMVSESQLKFIQNILIDCENVNNDFEIILQSLKKNNVSLDLVPFTNYEFLKFLFKS